MQLGVSRERGVKRHTCTTRWRPGDTREWSSPLIRPSNVEHGLLATEKLMRSGATLRPSGMAALLSTTADVLHSDWASMAAQLRNDASVVKASGPRSLAIEHAAEAHAQLQIIRDRGTPSFAQQATAGAGSQTRTSRARTQPAPPSSPDPDVLARMKQAGFGVTPAWIEKFQRQADHSGVPLSTMLDHIGLVREAGFGDQPAHHFTWYRDLAARAEQDGIGVHTLLDHVQLVRSAGLGSRPSESYEWYKNIADRATQDGVRIDTLLDRVKLVGSAGFGATHADQYAWYRAIANQSRDAGVQFSSWVATHPHGS